MLALGLAYSVLGAPAVPVANSLEASGATGSLSKLVDPRTPVSAQEKAEREAKRDANKANRENNPAHSGSGGEQHYNDPLTATTATTATSASGGRAGADKEALEAKREANRERRANNAAHGGTGAGEATEHHAMGQVHGDSAGSEDARKACREEQRKAGNHDPVKIQAACSGAGGGGGGGGGAKQSSGSEQQSDKDFQDKIDKGQAEVTVSDVGDAPAEPPPITGSNKIVYWLPAGKEGDAIADQAGLDEGNICAAFGAPQCSFERVDMLDCTPHLPNCGFPNDAVHQKTQGADVVIVPVQVATTMAAAYWPYDSTDGGESDGRGHVNKQVYHAMEGHQLKEEYLPARPATRVLYWRESYDAVLPEAMQAQFDLLMGHQYFASVINPSFFVGARQVFFNVPATTTAGTTREDWEEAQVAARVPPHERPGVAISMVSHCGAPSGRDEYLEELSKYIAIDRFGACHEKRDNTNIKGAFPTVKGKSDFDAHVIKFTAQYKFYLGFENELADGYATEKLLENPLVSGNIPVHLGNDADMPSIDGKNSPWFISAKDFKSPRELGEFLNKIASSQSEMDKYVAWRKGMDQNSVLFPNANPGVKKAIATAEYVEYVGEDPRQLPGKFQEGFSKFGDKLPRTRALCELCDASYVAQLKKSTPLRPIPQATAIEESRGILGIGGASKNASSASRV